MKKNTAGQVVGVQMITAADGSGFGDAVTVVVTIDGGTQSASGGTGPTHEGTGFHSYLPTQAETNGDHVAFTFTGTGAIPVTVQVYTTFPQTGDNFARLGAPAGASVSADVAEVKAETASILTDTAEIGAAGAGLTNINLPNQTMDIIGDITGNLSGSVASVTGAINTAAGTITTLDGLDTAQDTQHGTTQTAIADVPTVAEFEARTVVAASYFDPATDRVLLDKTDALRVTGSVDDASATTTAFVSDLTEATDDHYIGRHVIFTSGALLGQASAITDYDGTTKTLTVEALTEAPANGVTFEMV
jgi:hypothetical protein